MEQTYPDFHDGSSKTLEEAISILGETQLGRTFNEEEVSLLVAFMKTHICPPVPMVTCAFGKTLQPDPPVPQNPGILFGDGGSI